MASQTHQEVLPQSRDSFKLLLVGRPTPSPEEGKESLKPLKHPNPHFQHLSTLLKNEKERNEMKRRKARKLVTILFPTHKPPPSLLALPANGISSSFGTSSHRAP